MRWWDPVTLRCRALVFLSLAVLFLAGMTGFRTWGWRWAAAAYRPLLLETVTAARASQVFGQAEAALLKAVETTPPYAYTVLDAVQGDLPVLPELGETLLRIFDEDAGEGRRREEAFLNATRVRFGRSAYQDILARTQQAGGERASWQADYFFGKARSILGQGPDPGMASDGTAATRVMVPEIREVMKGLWAVRDLASSGEQDLVTRYLSASASLGLGDRAAARKELTDLAGNIERLPDIAYRLGVLEELEGNPEMALTWYARAAAASDRHVDAAAACIRLQPRSD